ncbi:hypothetical protein FACS1894172_08150 [Spirochaetia bacterium]|nr:hypothetical protein FACS1894164_07750 [Spirochaetia bacterium]GHU32111.1 hypothetical protein FACS1894172_08150 [Spirochaetia bacterium]
MPKRVRLKKEYIYAKQLKRKTKFLRPDYPYMNGEPGDFLAVKSNEKSVYIIHRKVFEKTYDKVSD